MPFDPAKDEPPEMLQIVTDDRLRDPSAYPLNEDTRLFEAGLREALSRVEETGTWERLGIRWASDRFRECSVIALLEHLWRGLALALKYVPTSLSP